MKEGDAVNHHLVRRTDDVELALHRSSDFSPGARFIHQMQAGWSMPCSQRVSGQRTVVLAFLGRSEDAQLRRRNGTP
jgi:hypothetical protein